MASSVRSKGPVIEDTSKSSKENMKKQTSPPPRSNEANANANKHESKILTELALIRKENLEGHNQTKLSLTKLETTIQELKGEITTLKNRTTETESRISAAEDKGLRHERAIRYLMHRELDLTTRYEDLQNRLRRNNMRIYRVAEKSEGKDMKQFVKELIKEVLQPMPDVNLQFERAHRALRAKSSDPDAAPRSIIVKFLDFTAKEAVLKQAWSQKQMLYNEQPIFFDHDYSPVLQKKRMQVRDVVYKLKEKNIKAKCIYPAQIRITTQDGDKTYPTLAEAVPALQELGIEVRVSERERMEKELIDHGWNTTGKRRGKDSETLSTADVRAFMEPEGAAAIDNNE